MELFLSSSHFPLRHSISWKFSNPCCPEQGNFLHPPSKLLYRCLATTDMLVGLVTQHLTATYWIPLVHERYSLCRYARDAAFISSYSLCSLSLLTLTSISVDTSRSVVGNRIQTNSNFKAHMYHNRYVLDFIRSHCIILHFTYLNYHWV